jgi:hypothetical protein
VSQFPEYRDGECVTDGKLPAAPQAWMKPTDWALLVSGASFLVLWTVTEDLQMGVISVVGFWGVLAVRLVQTGMERSRSRRRAQI